MAQLSGSARTFAERYCEAHGLTSEQFDDHFLACVLHRPLGWIWPLVRPFVKQRFEVDRFCIRMVGKYSSHRKLNEELVEFSYHPHNRNFWRQYAGFRLSTHRVRRALRNLPS